MQRRRGDRFVVDPDFREETATDSEAKVANDGSITIGYQPSLDQVSAFQHEGLMDSDLLADDVERLTKVCKEILPSVQSCLIQSLKAGAKTTKTKGKDKK